MIFDKEIFLKIFKHFRFNKEKEVQKIYYNNCIYQGQGFVQDNEFVKHGQGAFFTNKGEFFQGEFQNDKIVGEGNFLLWNGSFLRGYFDKGQLNGNCLYINEKDDIYLMQFQQGILQGIISYMPQDQNVCISMLFENGRFVREIQKVIFEKEKSNQIKVDIVCQIFENQHLLLSDKELFKNLKNFKKNKLFFGNYLLQDQYFYCGGFQQDQMIDGLGLLIDFKTKVIQIGDFQNGDIQNVGMKITNKYCFMGGFKDGLLNGKVIVHSFEKNQHKECLYQFGKYKDIIKEDFGNYNKIIDFSYFRVLNGYREDYEYEVSIFCDIQKIVVKQDRITFSQEEPIFNYVQPRLESTNVRLNQLNNTDSQSQNQRLSQGKQRIQKSQSLKKSDISTKSLHKMNCNDFIEEVKFLKSVMREEYKKQHKKKIIIKK